MIYVIATITVHPGTAEALLAAAHPAIAETRKETGCIAYDLHQSVTAPDTFVFVERWGTREQLAAHMQTPHFKVWREAAKDLIATRKLEIISGGAVETM